MKTSRGENRPSYIVNAHLHPIDRFLCAASYDLTERAWPVPFPWLDHGFQLINHVIQRLQVALFAAKRWFGFFEQDAINFGQDDLM